MVPGRKITDVLMIAGALCGCFTQADADDLGRPFLLQDLNRASPSFPHDFVPAGDRMFFLVEKDGLHTTSLWVTDGMGAATHFVHEFGYHLNDLNNSKSTKAGVLYFSTYDSNDGIELWISDGTQEGTRPFREVLKLPGDVHVFFRPAELGNLLVFGVSDDISSVGPGSDLWATDGTAEGTRLVRKFSPNEQSSCAPFYFGDSDSSIIGGLLYFNADDGIHGRELWVTDGTTAGTRLAADIEAGRGSSDPCSMTAIDGSLYFSATTTEFGRELWVFNPATEELNLVADIVPGPGSSDAYPIGIFRSTLFFSAADSQGRIDLWITDHAKGSAQRLSDAIGIHQGFSWDWNHLWNRHDLQLAPLGDAFAFVAESDGRYGLWVSDGTPGGTRFVQQIDLLSGLVSLGDRLYFAADDGVHGFELWTSDGTADGTRMLKDIGPANGPGAFTNGYNMLRFASSAAGWLYFAADDGNGSELWTSDGTEQGTRLLADINKVTSPSAPIDWRGSWVVSNFVKLGDKVFFPAVLSDSTFLAATDGTPEGTRLLDIPLLSGGSLWSVNGRLMSSGSLVIDPAEKSIQSLREVLGQAEGWQSLPGRDWIPFGDVVLLFVTQSTEAEAEIWVTNWTPEGTKPLRESLGQSTTWRMTWPPLVAGEGLFGTADDGVHGLELWVSDGTSKGTRLVEDMAPGNASSYILIEGALGSRALFTVGVGNWKELGGLWVTDGTEVGTKLLHPSIFDIREVVTLVGLAYMSGSLMDADHSAYPGIWVTDGSPEGTRLVSEGIAERLTTFDNSVYFSRGTELWVTNGSSEGTRLVSANVPCRHEGIRCVTGIGPTIAGNWSFFGAWDSEHGYELWVFDFTTGNLRIVEDIRQGLADGLHRWFDLDGYSHGTPTFFWPEKNLLLFFADDGTTGYEPWALSLTSSPQSFHRGDPNSSGTTDISDGIAIFGFLFLGDPPTLSCKESADANNDGTIDISDGIYLLSWLFTGGPEPAAPGPTGVPCGFDPDPPGSPGDLGCEGYAGCH
ncbi:MAG: hypothetical protein HY717_23230 [Planctomycetes bacterium]|nr:hypothetical protein [Planctomycetota bacterium]